MSLHFAKIVLRFSINNVAVRHTGQRTAARPGRPDEKRRKMIANLDMFLSPQQHPPHRKEKRMTNSGSEMAVDLTRVRTLVLGFCLAFVMALMFPLAAFCATERLVDSDEYKEKDFQKGVITDYSDMVRGDDIAWIWTAPNQKLAQYKLKLGTVENKSDIHSKSLVETVKSSFKDAFADMDVKSAKGTLTADTCIVWAQNFSPGKAWIPFAGGYQMQAGIGIELVLHDDSGKTVAKFRHFARQGTELSGAAQQVIGELTGYISKH